jgi:hypothetical protein
VFIDLKKQVRDNFDKLSKNPLFYVDIDRDEIFQQYLNGFEEETKQSHNCNSCKSFLRQYAGVVAIIDNKRVSIWDNIVAEPEYQKSVENLANYIHSLPITNVFLNEFAKCGTDSNLDKVRGVQWNHFYFELPSKFVNSRDIDAVRGRKRTNKETLMRSLEELTINTTETILDLIAQNSLYRGKEFESGLKNFLSLQKEYQTIDDKENYCWLKSTELPESACNIRGTAIGTLLVDLSEDKMDLDGCVTKFERLVAPSNYKRPTALVTPKMVEQAKEKLTELGLLGSLERRYANETDLSVENILHTENSSVVTDVFGEIAKDTLVNPKTFSKVDEVTIEDFIKKVLPTSKSIEVLVENSHLPNFVSLLTSCEKETPSLFKWDNNFSWNYTGGITDSVKERVKQAGGNVDGELRISLSWSNHDDLDLHVIQPNGSLIYYGDKQGKLDVDMNAGGMNLTNEPVENVIFTENPLEGKYVVKVNNFCRRVSNNKGYEVQIECRGEVYDFEFEKSPSDGATQTIVEFNYSRTNGVTFKSKVKSQIVSKEKWGIKTNQFVKVKKVMLSPNHWDKPTGNKHYMFFIENCVSDEDARPFFNEFLKSEFDENRKVFEIMGSKIKVEKTNNQLSGIAFSETQKNHLLVRVDGNFKRVIKINF